MKQSKPYSLALILCLMLLVLSGAIAVPLLWRGFYYLHITAMDLPALTGWTAPEIREAFDQMMDFCMWGAPFGTGVLKWSQSGYEHFVDCAGLFRLDLGILAASAMGLLALCHSRREGLRPMPLLGHGPAFWAGTLLATAFAAIAGLAALDFDRAFVIFHSLFFPGKTNWIFDWRTDEIILVLPQDFFMHCGMLIVGVLLLLCLLLIYIDKKIS